MPASAAIYGCQGTELSAAERDFFRATRPFGFILFARNCVEPAQIRALAQSDRVPQLRATGFRDPPPQRAPREGQKMDVQVVDATAPSRPRPPSNPPSPSSPPPVPSKPQRPPQPPIEMHAATCWRHNA